MKKVCAFLFGLVVLAVLISLIMTLMNKTSLKEKVGLVRIEGVILDPKNIVDEIREYAKDSSIRAIVIRVDSPGGGVAPSQEIYEEVKKAEKKKRVVVSMGSVAASGGYYVSCPADRIVANPGTLTGSIGVIMEIPNIEGLMKKIGVKTEVIKSGKYKDIASAFRAMAPQERQILQGVLDDVHEQFIRAVADGRKMKFDAVKELADGRIFTGRQAKAIGLVDELGDLEDAIRLAAKLGGIKGEPAVEQKKERFTILDLIRGKFPKEFQNIIPGARLEYLFSP